MTTHSHINLVIFTAFVLYGCSHSNNQKTDVQYSKKVEIDLVIPHVVSNKAFYTDCSDNKFAVIIRNTTDSVIRVYDNEDNEWGYYNVSFEIKTSDSIYIIKKKETSWLRSYPTEYEINPNESFVFNCNLKDYSCYLQNVKGPMIRGEYQGWTGLPQKTYDSAMIKAIYVTNNISDTNLQRSFPTNLETKYYKIEIEKSDYIPFKKVIDLK